MAVDALRNPFYSSRHSRGSHVQGNQFDLGNPGWMRFRITPLTRRLLKRRLLAVCARAYGAQVLWGWCYDGEGAPPYWPWLQLITAYTQQKESETLLAEMGTGAYDIAEIVPEVRTRFPDLPVPPALEPQQARFRLFYSITSLWKNAARVQPLILILDALHCADKPSLLLLEFLCCPAGPSLRPSQTHHRGGEANALCSDSWGTGARQLRL